MEGRTEEMKIDARTMEWIRKPNVCNITEDKVTITTEPFTDLWQRTYYHFRNDNAPILQMKSEEQFFSFVVRTDFDTKVRYDQSGIIMYLDSDNWIKASMEYENEEIQRLGSVVTNNGYSDWSSTDIDAKIKSVKITNKFAEIGPKKGQIKMYLPTSNEVNKTYTIDKRMTYYCKNCQR